MINPDFYNLLPIEDKVGLLCERGELLVAVATSDYDVSLYALDGQYIELYYSIAYNRISDIKVLEDPRRLELFTRNIDIEELLS